MSVIIDWLTDVLCWLGFTRACDTPADPVADDSGEYVKDETGLTRHSVTNQVLVLGSHWTRTYEPFAENTVSSRDSCIKSCISDTKCAGVQFLPSQHKCRKFEFVQPAEERDEADLEEPGVVWLRPRLAGQFASRVPGETDPVFVQHTDPVDVINGAPLTIACSDTKQFIRPSLFIPIAALDKETAESQLEQVASDEQMLQQLRANTEQLYSKYCTSSRCEVPVPAVSQDAVGFSASFKCFDSQEDRDAYDQVVSSRS